ncbi:MAG: hypothetical protein ACRCTL_01760 [Pseudomonas sp.]
MSKSIKKVAAIGGIIAAPFTGGASLALTGAVMASEMMKTPSATGSAMPEVAAAPTAAAPTAVDPAAIAAREDQKKRQAAAAGLSANTLTGAGGLSSKANTQMKSLLGS